MSLRTTSIRIPESEHEDRCKKLEEHLRAEDTEVVVLFDSSYIQYYSGFSFIPTERPVAFVMNLEGERALFVPRLEREHAQANGFSDRVVDYPEYPDQNHPLEALATLLSEMGIKDKLAVDEDGYPWILGYQGPAISELGGWQVIPIRPFIEHQMSIKSEAEIRLIRESVRWGNLAHQLLQRYTQVGATETEVSQRASNEAHRAMLSAIGPIYKAQSPFSEGASAGYRGQIGRNASIPHAMAANITFQAGDVLVTGAGAPVWGYHSELERTMILGEPTKGQREFFAHMVALQDLALESIMPGIPCSKVDTVIRAYYREHGLGEYWKHHTGHTIGLRYHEGPFLDIGDDTEIQPGMVFTVEPGLYVDGIGGFRHSDTVLVVEDGAEVLTYYPRDLESLTLSL